MSKSFNIWRLHEKKLQLFKCFLWSVCYADGTLSTENHSVLKLLEDISPFCGATDTPDLNFCGCLPWVSKPWWITCLCASPLMCNGFVRFTSGPTSADLVIASIVAEPLWSMYLYQRYIVDLYALVGLKPKIECAVVCTLTVWAIPARP